MLHIFDNSKPNNKFFCFVLGPGKVQKEKDCQATNKWYLKKNRSLLTSWSL